MKEIALVILHNFKCHAHSEVPFEHFTALIGPSNSGKSTIIKGIRLCLYNEPNGDRFITHGEKLCYVEVQFHEDGQYAGAIRRTKGAEIGPDGKDVEINKYEIKHPDGTISEYTNFGQGAFEPVVAFHGMPKVNLFGDLESLNICDQLSAPFFLANTSGKRAKMVGKLAKTDIVDRALDNVKADLRMQTAQKKDLKARIKTKEDELKEMDNLILAEGAMSGLRKKLNAAKEEESRLNRIIFIKQQLEILDEKREKLFNFIKKETELNNVIDQLDRILLLNDRMTKITVLQSNLLKSEELKNSTQVILNTIDMSRLEEVIQQMDTILGTVNYICSMQRIYEKLKAEMLKRDSAQNIIDQIHGVDEIIQKLEDCKARLMEMDKIMTVFGKLEAEQLREKKGTGIIADLQGQYDGKFKEYKNMLVENKVCPVCQSEITEGKVESIKDLI
jgi:DNA repair exonuclease SbcCD ATPase subunit